MRLHARHLCPAAAAVAEAALSPGANMSQTLVSGAHAKCAHPVVVSHFQAQAFSVSAFCAVCMGGALGLAPSA